MQTRAKPATIAFAALAVFGAGTGVAFVGAQTAVAEDWKPFAEIDARRAKERARRRQEADRAPKLPSFEQGAAPWNNRSPQGAPGAYDSSDRSGFASGASGSVPPSQYIAPGRDSPLVGDDDVTVSRTDLAPITPQPAAPAGEAPFAPRQGQQPRAADGWPGTIDRRGRGTVDRRGRGTASTDLSPRDVDRLNRRDAASGFAPRRRAASGARLSLRPEDERLLQKIPLPATSPTLRRMLTRLLQDTTTASPATALARLEAGISAGRTPPSAPPRSANTLSHLIAANVALSRRDDETACEAAKTALSAAQSLKTVARGQAIVLGGYCAMRGDDLSGGRLAATLAREAGYDKPLTLMLLENGGRPGALPKPKSVTILDLRLMERGEASPTAQLIPAMTPPALVYAARHASDPTVRVLASEAAAARHLIDPPELAQAYDAAAADVSGRPRLDGDTPASRIGLWQAIQQDRAFYQRTRNIRAFLNSARRAGFHDAALRLVAPAVADVPRIAEIGWFAETAIEVHIAAGEPEPARAWASFAVGRDPRSGGDLGHWQALIAVADPRIGPQEGSRSLPTLIPTVQRGRFAPKALHRLATVLDALNYNVPIEVWDSANRTPQPTDGALPETGTLRNLADAAKARDISRTSLLVMAALGKDGPAGSNLLPLGDSIRALQRVGQRDAARALAVEALLPVWPRAVVN